MTSVEVEAADDEQITLECVRTLFRQIPNSFAAAIVVTVYMVATAAPFIPRTTIAAWLALQIATQGGRVWIMTAYRRLGPAPGW